MFFPSQLLKGEYQLLKNKMLWLILFMLAVLSACSSNQSNDRVQSTSEMDVAPSDHIEATVDQAEKMDTDTSDGNVNSEMISSNRMVIHQAHLQTKVAEFQDVQRKIEIKVQELGGYVIESNTYRENEEMHRGKMVIRIPEEHFQQMLFYMEEQAIEVTERNITGQDVTEQYVDLESRLNSKRAVEARLLDFMKDAKETEDLLKISTDLAKIQEEIEVIVGKMQYIENQAAFSTITFHMFEDRVVIPSLENKDLNTWEKTKKQLMTSTNYLIAAFSWLVVFFIGNIPILFVLILIGFGIYYFVSKKSQQL